MIIKYPTGFYREQLSGFLSTTNITYNISNSPPVRSSIIFQKVPDGIASIKIPARVTARSTKGDLIFTVTNGSGSTIGTGQKIKNIGDYLEFSDIVSVQDPLPVAETVSEISHDLAYFDYTKMGLGNEEVSFLQSQLQTEFDNKTVLVNNLKTSLNNTNTEIENLNKQFNEVNSAIRALLLANSSALSDILARLDKQSDALNQQINQLVLVSSDLNAQIVTESNNLRTLGALIK